MPRQFRYLDILITMFVVILLVSNLVAQKIIRIGPFATSGAIILFPITYIFGGIFTEVYGYTASRRAIWPGFIGTALMYGTYPAATLAKIILTSYFLKVAYEALATPLTYLVVNFLKRAEDSDPFDAHTNFNPFRLAEKEQP